jgi:uncharacterized protein (DUF58 family)
MHRSIRRSMRRDLLLSLVTYGLIITGLITLNSQVLALCLLFVVYLVASLLRAPQSIQLELSHSLSAERVGTQVPVEVSVTVTNTGSELEEVLIEDALPPNLSVTKGSPRHLLYLPQKKSFTWSYTLQGTRGTYSFPPPQVEACDPFNLIRRQQEPLSVTKADASAQQLFVLPPILRLKHITIRPRRTRVYSGIVPARAGGIGVEFFGVREYQAGDPTKWINWRASAHHSSTLYSNEFEQERVADVGIVLDCRLRANVITGQHSIFEHSTLAAATLADVFLAMGNRVSLLLYGRYLNWTLPGYGKMQRERILRALAQAQLGSSQVFADLDNMPTRLFPKASQVVLVSPLTPDDQEILIRLRARGYQVMIISPDPVAFEASFLPSEPEIEMAQRVVHMERELMLQRLRRIGIQVVNWNISRPFDQVIHSRLDRPPAWIRAIGGTP